MEGAWLGLRRTVKDTESTQLIMYKDRLSQEVQIFRITVVFTDGVLPLLFGSMDTVACGKSPEHFVCNGGTREGWPLLTVETEVNGDSKSTIEGVLPCLVRWARRTGTRDFYPVLATLVSPSKKKKIFFAVCFFNLHGAEDKLGQTLRTHLKL
jgi:hypothetical protein